MIIHDLFRIRRQRHLIGAILAGATAIEARLFHKILAALGWRHDTEEQRQRLLDLQTETIAAIEAERTHDLAAAKERHARQRTEVRERIRPPLDAASPVVLDYELLDRADAAEARKRELADKLARVPDVSRSDLNVSLFLLLLSFMANVFFMNLFFGDSLAENATVSLALNALFGLIITAAEVVAPTSILSMLPERFRGLSVRAVSMAGGALLLAGVICILAGRGELGTMITSAATSAAIE